MKRQRCLRVSEESERFLLFCDNEPGHYAIQEGTSNFARGKNASLQLGDTKVLHVKLDALAADPQEVRAPNNFWHTLKKFQAILGPAGMRR